jgi:hypothetical protein
LQLLQNQRRFLAAVVLVVFAAFVAGQAVLLATSCHALTGCFCAVVPAAAAAYYPAAAQSYCCCCRWHLLPCVGCSKLLQVPQGQLQPLQQQTAAMTQLQLLLPLVSVLGSSLKP